MARDVLLHPHDAELASAPSDERLALKMPLLEVLVMLVEQTWLRFMTRTPQFLSSALSSADRAKGRRNACFGSLFPGRSRSKLR
jgi:hypothetical protein